MSRDREVGWAVADHPGTWKPGADSFPGFSPVYRSGRLRAYFVIALLVMSLPLTALIGMHDLSGFDLVRRAEAGELTLAEADRFDNWTQALALIDLLLYGVTALAFLAWLSRSVDNVPSLTLTRPLVTPRWSIGWWFIPFANFVQPYRIVNDLYTRLTTRPRRSLTVILWWVAWILMQLMSIALFRRPAPTTAQELESQFTVMVAIDVVTFVAALLAIVVVWRIQSFADARAAANSTRPEPLELEPIAGAP